MRAETAATTTVNRKSKNTNWQRKSKWLGKCWNEVNSEFISLATCCSTPANSVHISIHRAHIMMEHFIYFIWPLRLHYVILAMCNAYLCRKLQMCFFFLILQQRIKIHIHFSANLLIKTKLQTFSRTVRSSDNQEPKRVSIYRTVFPSQRTI